VSSNARRRYPKIVIPSDPEDNQELAGGLRNALERGENIDKAKKSFISAGYKKTKVETTTEETPKIIPQVEKTTPIPTGINPNQQKPASKKFLIIMVTIGILILITAGILGFFWEKIF
jgi:hypothetical protein